MQIPPLQMNSREIHRFSLNLYHINLHQLIKEKGSKDKVDF